MTATTKTESSKMTANQKKIAMTAFPEYRGRKFTARTQATYTMENYWDGGSRVYVKAVNLATGLVVEAARVSTNPYNKAAHAEFEIPQGVAMIEHSFFCGKDCGLTFIVAPPLAVEAAGPVLAIA